MAVPFVFWIGIFLVGLLQPDYHLLVDTVSKMGRSGRPYAELANGILILTGLFLALFARALPGAIINRKPANFLAFFGILGLMGGGLLPCDEFCAGDSLANVLHTVPVALGFVCLQIALFQIATQGFGNSPWQGVSAMALTLFQAGPFALAFFVLGRWGIVSQFDDYAGLSEKVYLAILFSFIFTLARRSRRNLHSSDQQVGSN
jgi:hypothetical membrane protein